MVGGTRPASPGEALRGIETVPFELCDTASIAAALKSPVDAVLHLAAVASSSAVRADPGAAWNINAAGTARLVHVLLEARDAGAMDPLVVVVSSGEVYGAGTAGARPRLETDAVAPQSSYAASKVAAEVAALEGWRRGGLRVVVARSFQHIGPTQTVRYVVPALARRLLDAKASGATDIPVGNLTPVRDILDVRDVAAAYLALLANGTPGETYNVSRGTGLALTDVFDRLAAIVGVSAVPVPDPSLTRRADVPHLVGDGTKLRAATGWSPSYSLDDSLRDVVDAQAH